MPGITEILQMTPSDGPRLVSSSAETSLLAPPRLVIPAGYLTQGRGLRIRAQGRVSCIVTAPGTLSFAFYLTEQVTQGRIKVIDGGAMPLNIVAKVDVGWELDVLAVVRGYREFSTFMWSGRWASEALIGAALPAAGGVGVRVLPASGMAAGAAFDATKAHELDFTAAFSVSNAGNGITLHQMIVEAARAGE